SFFLIIYFASFARLCVKNFFNPRLSAFICGFLIFIFTFASFPINAAEKPSEPGKLFDAQTYTLDNGLQIVVIPDHRAPVVTHMVWYKTGAAEETPGKSGAAHFLEHLMFKGSRDLAPGEFSKKVRAQGGDDNAFTGHDYTAFYQNIASDQLETVMN